ncbi:MAG: nickel-responsive transcriptional regulator NikR [Candidatus Thorarchaeota archaeon]|nr:MAG: nickel-responsive transcriptional regulator NikR [Candidatus Thorarchaeota archaeon]
MPMTHQESEPELKRFGVSVPEDLLRRFDKIVKKRGYVGRSEAIRDAMRGFIAQCEWESKQEGRLATLNIVYRHHPRLMSDLIKVQHSSKAHVISTVHVHLTHSHCFEALTIKGDRDDIEKLANRIGGLTGIEYVRLFVFSLPDDEDGHEH